VVAGEGSDGHERTMPEETAAEMSVSGGASSSERSGEADLPAGDLPPVPKWTVVLGFGLWVAWLIFLVIAAFMVRT